MYQVVALFDVAAERQQEFIDAALKDGRDSLAERNRDETLRAPPGGNARGRRDTKPLCP